MGYILFLGVWLTTAASLSRQNTEANVPVVNVSVNVFSDVREEAKWGCFQPKHWVCISLLPVQGLEDLIKKTKELEQQIQNKDDLISKIKDGLEPLKETVTVNLESVDDISEVSTARYVCCVLNYIWNALWRANGTGFITVWIAVKVCTMIFGRLTLMILRQYLYCHQQVAVCFVLIKCHIINSQWTVEFYMTKYGMSIQRQSIVVGDERHCLMCNVSLSVGHVWWCFLWVCGKCLGIVASNQFTLVGKTKNLSTYTYLYIF